MLMLGLNEAIDQSAMPYGVHSYGCVLRRKDSDVTEKTIRG